MIKILKYAGAYLMWIADLGLTFWLGFLSRTVFIGLLSLSDKADQVDYAHRVDFADKIFLIILGLGWLGFMIVAESYFRAGALGNDLFKRFARVTGPVLLGIFSVDLILLWLQGVGGGTLIRWLILAAELGVGIALLVSVRYQSKSETT